MWKTISIALFITGAVGLAGIFKLELLKFFIPSLLILVMIIGILFLIFAGRFQRD
jgi:hypothetical protein